MSQTRISIDVMGGDRDVETVLTGVTLALAHRPETSFLLFGDTKQIEPFLKRFPTLKAASSVHHCDVAIDMDMKPSQALRQGRKTSSMWQAIDAVNTGIADGAVSAGNTGALMAMSKVILKTLNGIERPAIAAIWPTMKGETIVLDMGATIGGSAEQYFQFAVMGDAYARIIFGLESPRISLLNIGVEEMKGTDSVKQAADLLTSSSLNFCGYIEGNGISQGDVDVVVTDGFTGNVALKTAEGIAQLISSYLKQVMVSSIFARIGYIFARGAFGALKERLDPDNVNGGTFLGLNGVVVKSHGGASPKGIAAAVELAIEVAANNMSEKIVDEMDKMEEELLATQE
ncbi:MAG: phosphate acyltransferase PlsX [Candidatus Micropelagos sp.]|uniref:Phosphate acyltransferase n=1 Tax=PS1 clade bacterium TaxID=2175152 RepID=A0A368EMD4_9PROT|nr:MAG: phosphate acyltransferase PlsX [PS1 clade bacterium]HCN32080.1 phosphate acyltransferase PlsX [Rhodobiaceae bacterium]|tara:strand:+ start:1149 stop:2180 length:1032 start_codon:yes stop_codon:yes gene_type:complete